MIGIDEIEFGLLDILRDVNEDWALATGLGDVERSLDRAGQVCDILDEPGVLHDRHRDARRVDLLEGVGADQARAHLTRVQTSGVESIHASAIAVTRFVAPGPEVAIATPTFPEARA